MIHVLAIITAMPGMRDRILDAWRANVDAVRAEDGCLAYDAVIDVRDGAHRIDVGAPGVEDSVAHARQGGDDGEDMDHRELPRDRPPTVGLGLHSPRGCVAP